MKVVVGLGNPGREYESTRHNVGWWAVDHLADSWHFDRWRKDGEALVAQGIVGAQKVRLVKPLTFMNLSGAVLRPYMRREAWSAERDLLVIVDDVAIEVARMRLRAGGSAGGHNGLKSIEQTLRSQKYARLRLGIKPQDENRRIGDLSDYVLSPFGREERELITALMSRMREAVECWLAEGIEPAMSRYNRESTTT